MTVPPPEPSRYDAPPGGAPAADPWAGPAGPGGAGPGHPAGPGGAWAPAPVPVRSRRWLWWGIGLGAGGLLIGAVVVFVVLTLVVGPALGRGLTSGADRSGDAGAGVSAVEQDYLDTLEDVTYYNFTDEDLVAMGHQLCAGLDEGEDLAAVEAALSDDFGAGGGDTWDIAWTATHTLCEQHADLTDDGSYGDGGDGSAGTFDTGWSRA